MKYALISLTTQKVLFHLKHILCEQDANVESKHGAVSPGLRVPTTFHVVESACKIYKGYPVG